MDDLKRQDVWEALSNFYLDTELTDADYRYINEKFANSGYTLNEIKQIDHYEVFPSLYRNLSQVAGEWSGFDKDWLVRECTKNVQKRSQFRFRIWVLYLVIFYGRMNDDVWKKIDV